MGRTARPARPSESASTKGFVEKFRHIVIVYRCKVPTSRVIRIRGNRAWVVPRAEAVGSPFPYGSRWSHAQSLCGAVCACRLCGLTVLTHNGYVSSFEPQPGFVARGDARGHGPRKGKWTLCRCRRGWRVSARPSGGAHSSRHDPTLTSQLSFSTLHVQYSRGCSCRKVSKYIHIVESDR